MSLDKDKENEEVTEVEDQNSAGSTKEEKTKASKKPKKSEATKDDIEALGKHLGLLCTSLGDPVEGENPNITDRRAWAARCQKWVESKGKK